MRIRRLWAAAGLLVLAPGFAQTGAPPVSRGALLYDTHCGECHSTQMHWRDNRVATDWPSLRRQVQRWQARAGRGGSDDDITEVARHLNERFYRFAPGGPTLSLATDTPATAVGRAASPTGR